MVLEEAIHADKKKKNLVNMSNLSTGPLRMCMLWFFVVFCCFVLFFASRKKKKKNKYKLHPERQA